MLSALLLVVGLASCSDFGAGFDASDRVRTAFQQYRAAVLAKDGEAAADLVSERTLAVYDEWRTAALTADRESLGLESVMVQLYVLRTRIDFSARELKRLSGRDLFVHSVRERWTRLPSIEESEAGIARIEEKSASLALDDGKNESELPFVFENEDWKLDLGVVLEAEAAAMADRAKNSGVGPKAFVERRLAPDSSKTLTAALWDGPRD